jgi:hypothetical protein
LIFNAIGYGRTRRRSTIVQAVAYLLIIVAKNVLNQQVNDVPLQPFLSGTLADLV